MTAYLVRWILALIPVVVVVATIAFLLIHLIPGDPVSVMLGPDATPDQIEAIRKFIGLDRPVHERLLKFYVKGDP
jgi:peptide/nickel transport system permease protein